MGPGTEPAEAVAPAAGRPGEVARAAPGLRFAPGAAPDAWIEAPRGL
ncbi:hypothetical protein [Streptomyces bikiniensis]|nr:hypothetical protein [Streptomyces bikiniensis]